MLQEVSKIRQISVDIGAINIIEKVDALGNYDRKKIVSHDHNGQKKKELDIVNKPTDITKVNDETIAVSSFPSTIFEINIETMTLLKTLTIGAIVWGLCFVGDEYITAQGNTISWLNSATGEKLRCCETDANTPFVTCYKSTTYIYTNGKNLSNKNRLLKNVSITKVKL
ncbi:unnamed protein product [Mytilus edulis]|uniref:Uncharacterized protein n=1 Tax=Mytilus edulis TaxID=6550 RepID=A0A8S3QCQ7_MYTED|nr:unnamed protein product [Mytilus edulis]